MCEIKIPKRIIYMEINSKTVYQTVNQFLRLLPMAGVASVCRPTNCAGPSPSKKSLNWLLAPRFTPEKIKLMQKTQNESPIPQKKQPHQGYKITLVLLHSGCTVSIICALSWFIPQLSGEAICLYSLFTAWKIARKLPRWNNPSQRTIEP